MCRDILMVLDNQELVAVENLPYLPFYFLNYFSKVFFFNYSKKFDSSHVHVHLFGFDVIGRAEYNTRSDCLQLNHVTEAEHVTCKTSSHNTGSNGCTCVVPISDRNSFFLHRFKRGLRLDNHAGI